MLTPEDIKKILEAIQEAYKESDIEIKTITMHTGDEVETLVDNTKEEIVH